MEVHLHQLSPMSSGIRFINIISGLATCCHHLRHTHTTSDVSVDCSVYTQQTQLARHFQLSSAIAAAGITHVIAATIKGLPTSAITCSSKKTYLSTVCVHTAKHRHKRLMLKCCYAEAALPSSE